MTKNVKDILKENEKRKDKLFGEYDPIMGTGGTLERFPFFFNPLQQKPVMLPVSMWNIPIIQRIIEGEYKNAEEYAKGNGLNPEKIAFDINEARLDHDFEFFAATTVKVKPKEGGELFPFILRPPQRKLLHELERQRKANLPIRIILLKARQWGGSTLVQIYMAWIQIRHKTNWNSIIAAHLNQAASNIRGMYTNLVKHYPLEDYKLKPFEGTTNIKIIYERSNKITIGSMERPDSVRSDDVSMAHLSEVGLWKKTDGKKPEDLIQSILGSIPRSPLSIVVMESTAKGVGNYFHNTWQFAKSNPNKSYSPVFVAWFEITNYFEEFESHQECLDLIGTLNKYEKEQLWDAGATLEGIKWYRSKLAEYNNNMVVMASEFPSNDIEAFQSSGSRYFAMDVIARARKFNRPPLFVGDVYADDYKGEKALKNIEIKKNNTGNLSVWNLPETYTNVKYVNRYLVTVDIGGRSKEADDSVIKVYDRFWMMEGGLMELAACWAGKIDFDHLAWKAVQLCKLYDDAFMVPEINKMREGTNKFDEGDQFYTLVDQIIDYYDNIFCRTTPEQVREGIPKVYGFHTNRQTKPMILSSLNAAYRDSQIANFDSRSMDQADSFENKGNGSTGAVEGAHDDHVIADALAAWAGLDYMPPVKEVKINQERNRKRRMVGESSF